MNLVTKLWLILLVMQSCTSCNSQIKNASTATVHIYGNCKMCKKTIEKAGNKQNIALVDWNKDTKMATLTYDTTQTKPAEILKQIALAGYDNEQFLAPKDAYAKLPECCQYERMNVMEQHATMDAPQEPSATMEQAPQQEVAPVEAPAKAVVHHQAPKSTKATVDPKVEQPKVDPLAMVYDRYFALKDALVQSDQTQASTAAKHLLAAIKGVKMSALENQAHMVWMQILDPITNDTEKISTQDLASQREHFIALSDKMYQLMKMSAPDTPTYYQHCPMANDGKGANWLSKENAVRNPYYGSVMLTCGKTVETIKQ